jgi:hypothetical protein
MRPHRRRPAASASCGGEFHHATLSQPATSRVIEARLADVEAKDNVFPHPDYRIYPS